MAQVCYTIYNRLGMFVNDCIPNITNTTVTRLTIEKFQHFGIQEHQNQS